MADWQASDGNTTHSFSNDEFIAAINKLRNEQKKGASHLADELEHLMGISGASPKQQPATPHWKNLDEMIAALETQKVAQTSKPVDPIKRRAEINTELDIIRGRIPTPKDYKIDPLRVKKLMQELKQLT